MLLRCHRGYSFSCQPFLASTLNRSKPFAQKHPTTMLLLVVAAVVAQALTLATVMVQLQSSRGSYRRGSATGMATLLEMFWIKAVQRHLIGCGGGGSPCLVKEEGMAVVHIS